MGKQSSTEFAGTQDLTGASVLVDSAVVFTPTTSTFDMDLPELDYDGQSLDIEAFFDMANNSTVNITLTDGTTTVTLASGISVASDDYLNCKVVIVRTGATACTVYTKVDMFDDSALSGDGTWNNTGVWSAAGKWQKTSSAALDVTAMQLKTSNILTVNSFGYAKKNV